MLDDPNLKGTLTQNLCRHNLRETASFHTPGHKGRFTALGMAALLDFTDSFDVTEVDGLDDLSHPAGVLKNLEHRIAAMYQAKGSVLSVSGASGGLLSAILAVAKRGSHLLVPRNAHRSVINAMVLSGLKPRWYEPEWNSSWSLWECVKPSTLEAAIENGGADGLAGILVVSPTYAGALSDIVSLSEIAHRYKLPLIVDEAQGAHFLSRSKAPKSACLSGADIVVHSFHKTLGALTQTGAVHVLNEKFITVESVRAAMRLVSTSSPNYLLLSSVEQTMMCFETEDGLARLNSAIDLAARLRRKVQNKTVVYDPAGFGTDPLHVLLACRALSGEQLSAFLLQRGIVAETVLGNGCLLLLGAGTVSKDIDLVEAAIADLPDADGPGTMIDVARPAPIDQVISPRDAFFAQAELVPARCAIGRIAADSLAPCPPGTPICVPGARVTAHEGFDSDEQIRVLVESG